MHLKGIQLLGNTRTMKDTRPFYVRQKGEIIIGKQNYFNGSIAIVSKEFDGCICSNAIMSFLVEEKCIEEYVYNYISRYDYMKKREYMANGTGQKELSEKDFLTFPIKIPLKKEQQKIASFLSAIDKKIKLEENNLKNLENMKKSFLQQMFV